jgi:nitroreductase
LTPQLKRKVAETMDKLAVTQVPLHPLLASRWSPRGFDPAHALAPEQLTALLEAARWAPSANNTQPWRFLVASRGEQTFDELLGVLNPGNRQWAGAASALILVAAETVDPDGNARPFALYDTGQAVANLVAQAGHEGLAVHQMGGFDSAAATARFGLGDGLQPVVVVAVGRHSAAAPLAEPFAAREHAPRVRRRVDELLLRQAAAV